MAGIGCRVTAFGYVPYMQGIKNIPGGGFNQFVLKKLETWGFHDVNFCHLTNISHILCQDGVGLVQSTTKHQLPTYDCDIMKMVADGWDVITLLEPP